MDIGSLKQQLIERKTAFVELEPCEKCGCSVYYYRKGRKHNGCVNCHVSAKNNHEVPTPATMIDEQGTPIYEGRACSVCGSRVRIGVAAYGANKGKCRDCAIHQQQEREHGKQLTRLSVAVSKHAHNFVVQSIERSGAVEVAPRNLMEWLELKDFVNRVRMMNEQEKILNTGIRWELCHHFPAAGGGTEFRGKATVDNLVIAQYEQNRSEGNSLPDEWSLKQIVTIADCRLIKNSYDARKAWENSRDWAQVSPEKQAEWRVKQQQQIDEHRDLVRTITKGFTDSLPIVERATFIPFSELVEKVELQWTKTLLQMNKIISAALVSGRKIDYIEARNDRLTIDAFHGAEARQWIVVQTLRQIADGEMILREKGITEEQEQQLATLKRCAVMWAFDINDNPRQLVMGFTHPLLEVLGNQWVWGTRYDDVTDQQWLCVWDNPTIAGIEDQRSPFDLANANHEVLTPDCINAIFTDQTKHPVKDWCADGWKSTDVDYIYEQERQKRARVAAEKRQEALREANRAKVCNRIASLKKWLTEVQSDLSGLYGYAAEMLHDVQQGEAIEIINRQYELVAGYESELDRIGQADYSTPEEAEKAVNHWQASNQCRVNQMMKGSHVFRDLLNPF